MNNRGVFALLALVVACVGLFVVPAMAKAAAPEVSLQQAAGQSDPTGSDAIEFSLTANESLVAGSVTESDFSITNGTFGEIVEEGPAEYTIAVTADSDGVVSIAPSETFEVTDLDEAATQNTVAGEDRSVTYDGTGPSVVLEQAAGQSDPTMVTSAQFTLTSDEPLDGSTVSASDFDVTNGSIGPIDGAGTSWTIIVDYTGDGEASIAPSGTFEVADQVGNTTATAAGADRSVVFDRTGPNLTLATAAGQDDPTDDPTITFTLSSNEPLNVNTVGNGDFDVTGAAITSIDSDTADEVDITVEATDQGLVQFNPSGAFAVSDTIGNSISAVSGNPTVLFDQAPVIYLAQDENQADPTNVSPIDFALESNENLSAGTIDATDFDVTNGTVNNITGSDASYIVEVTATDDGAVTIAPSENFSIDDANGNFAATDAALGTDRSVTFDDTAPDTSIDANPTNPSFDPTPTFGLAADEENVTFECRLWEANDAQPSFEPCLDPYNSAFLPEGNYNFEVRATDEAGNVGDTAFYIWARQQSALAAGPEEAVYFTRGDTPVEIKVVTEDDQAGEFSYELVDSLGGGTVGAWTVDDQANSATTNYTPGDGFAGEDIVTVKVTNNATGGETEAEVHILIRPVSKLNSGPGVNGDPQLTNDNTPTFTYSAVAGPNEGVVSGATFACRIDGAAMPNAACNTGSITTGTLSEGEHTFTVRASKPSINPDTTVASVTFTVDTINPDVPTVEGPMGLTNDNSLEWDYTVPEGVAECRFISDSDPDPAFTDCGNSPIQGVFMTDGEYTLEVRTRDDAGNYSGVVATYFTVDTNVDVTIDSAPSDGNTDALPAIEFSSPEDPDVTYECRLFQAGTEASEQPEFSACESPEQLPFLDRNIRYRFEVRATDPASNTDVASVEWNQANTAPAVVEPQVTLEAGTSGPVNLGGSDADSDVITYSITGEVTGGTLGEIDQDTGLVEFTADEDAAGEYTFEYEVTDEREDGTTTATATIYVQPNTVIDVEPAAETNDVTPTWEFSSPADNVTTFECNFNGGGWEACDSGSYTPSADLAEGTYTLEVRATIGTLFDPTPATSTVIIDITAPDVTITDQPLELSNDATPAFTFESADSTATFECKVDGGQFEDCESGDSIDAVTDGEHTFTVRSTDPGGNVSDPVATYTWEVDLTDPAISLGGTPANVTNGPGEGKQTNAKKPVWYFERSDLNLDSAKVRCWIDNGTPLETCLAPYQPATNLTDGDHTLHIEAEDLAGNLGEFSVNFKVNTLSASVAINDAPSSPSGPNAEFTFSSSTDLGAEGRFECRISLNGGAAGAWETCTSPLSYTNLSSAVRKLEVRAVDSAGNASTGSGIASYTWTTVGGAPDTVISGSNKSGNSATFGFNSPGNPLASFECKLDSGSWANCTSPKTYNNLGAGSHTFGVRAKNEVGTLDASPATQTWTSTADTAPNTSISRQPAAVTPETTANFEFSSSDSLATFECRVDGGAWAACESPKAITDVAVGAHKFEVRAKGSNGLIDATPASADWTVRAAVVDPPVTETCNPIAPNSMITGSAKLSKTLRVSATVSHSDARPGQVITVKLNASAKKKKALKKTLKSVVVSSGGTPVATLKAKSWSGSFTVAEGQADDLTLKFVRKKGKAMSKSAAFTVLPACVGK